MRCYKSNNTRYILNYKNIKGSTIPLFEDCLYYTPEQYSSGDIVK